jgi:HK97 family phage major capsid protein
MSVVADQTNEIVKISSAVNEISKNIADLDSKYAQKHEAKKLADAIDALNKAMDRQRLVEDADPVFGNKAVAGEFIDCLKGVMFRGDVKKARDVTLDKNSELYVEKDLNSYTNGSGADTIPTAVSNVLSVLQRQESVALRDATVIDNLQGSETFHRRDGTSTAAWQNASGGLKDDAPITPSVLSTTKITLTPQAMVSLSLVADKLLYSSAINLAQYVAQDLVEDQMALFDRDVINGDGTYSNGGINGIVNDSDIYEEVVTTSGFTNVDKLFDMIANVHEAVQNSPSACFYVSGPVFAAIRKMKAAVTGQYLIWDPTKLAFDMGGTTLKLWHRMDNTLANGKYIAFYGDMRRTLTVAKGRSMQLEVSRDYKFNTAQVAFRLVQDLTAGVIQPGAFARLLMTS